MARFIKCDDKDTEFFKEASAAANTSKSTNTWVNVYKEWAKERGYERNINEYEPGELDEILKLFYVEVRKKDGTTYEPQCLNVMITSLDRFLKNNSYPRSIVRDREFAASETILEGVARDLRSQGKGKIPNRTRSLAPDHEDVLWSSGELGCSTPRALIQTVWWCISQHFGMRGRTEHHNIKMEDFIIESEGDTEYVMFREGITKNHAGGLNYKTRLVKPKMYATGGKRCPVSIFKLYKQKRPFKLRNEGPFYLSVIDRPKKPEVWFKETPMGINTINLFMKHMVERTPLADVNRKSYDSGDEGEMMQLSTALTNPNQGQGPSMQRVYAQKSLQKNFSFGLPEITPQKCEKVYIFNGCSEFTVHTAEVGNKKRRRIISSDSSDEEN